MEHEKIYQISTDFAYFNQDGILKPYGYQHLLAQILDRHLDSLGTNMEATMDYGLGWVLRSISLEVKAQVPRGQTLTGKTWHSQRKGPYFRREYQFFDHQGKLLFEASSFSILLNLEDRSIFRQKEVPFELMSPTEILLLDTKPNFKAKGDYKPLEERLIRPSHIDGMGHVNNCRYGEFAYDSLTKATRNNLNQLKRIEFYFQAELALGDKFRMESKEDGDCTYLRGVRDGNDKCCFDVIMQF